MKHILRFSEISEGALPRRETVKKLEKIRKIIKKEIGGDIGDKISDMNKQGANIHYIHNPVDTGIESYEDYMSTAKPITLVQSKSK